MLKRVFVLFFILLCTPGLAQVNVDSLKSVWKDVEQPDTVKLKALGRIAWAYLFNQPDSGFYYAQTQFELAQTIDSQIWMAIASNTKGVSFKVKDDFFNALKSYQQGLELASAIGDQTTVKPHLLNNIGNVYYNLGDHANAIRYYIESLQLAEKNNNKKGMSTALVGISNVHFLQGEYAKSLEYLEQTHELATEIDDKNLLSTTSHNLGSAYLEEGDDSTALVYYNQALLIDQKLADRQGVGLNLTAIGRVMVNRKRYPEALSYFNRALKVANDVGDKKGASIAFINMSNVHEARKDFSKAISSSRNALAIAQDSRIIEQARDAANSLYRNYKAVGNTGLALEMYELRTTLRDSINRLENQREIIDQEYKYAYEKQAAADSVAFAKQEEIRIQDERIADVKRQRDWLLVISALVILAVITVAFFLRNTGLSAMNLELEHKNVLIVEQNSQLEDTLSKLKTTQTQLLQSEKMASIGQLIAGVAHEINNPVNFIISGTELLARDIQDLGKLIKEWQGQKVEKPDLATIVKNITESIEHVQMGGQRTAEIVEALRTFSYVDQVKMTKVDIHEIIESNLILLRNSLKGGINLEKDFIPSPEKIECAPGQINQVFLNILVNAIDAMHGEGNLTITTRDEGTQISIRIRDSGPGIPVDNLTKVFDPFFTTKDIGMGTGLGLSISYGIIKKHHGDIEVISEEGKGCEFVVTIPKRQPAA